MIVQEYTCPEHGKFDLLEDCNSEETPRPCPRCGATSPYCISAPATKIPVGVVVSGKSDERPPNALDTRPLADGMSSSEWHAKEQRKSWEIVRAKQRKDLV